MVVAHFWLTWQHICHGSVGKMSDLNETIGSLLENIIH